MTESEADEWEKSNLVITVLHRASAYAPIPLVDLGWTDPNIGSYIAKRWDLMGRDVVEIFNGRKVVYPVILNLVKVVLREETTTDSVINIPFPWIIKARVEGELPFTVQDVARDTWAPEGWNPESLANHLYDIIVSLLHQQSREISYWRSHQKYVAERAARAAAGAPVWACEHIWIFYDQESAGTRHEINNAILVMEWAKDENRVYEDDYLRPLVLCDACESSGASDIKQRTIPFTWDEYEEDEDDL